MIPVNLREEMANDPYYKKCCLTGYTNEKINWHHNFIYAGKQVNEKWCILPVKESIHQYHKGITSEVKEKLDYIMLNRFEGTMEDLAKKFPKINWEQKYKYLKNKYDIRN